MIINLFVLAFTLFGIREILLKQNGLSNSLQWIIIGFFIGYRTFEPFPGLKLHPIEIFIYASIIRIIGSHAIKYSRMPIFLKILSIFFITFFFIDILTRYNPYVLLEFKNFFLLTLLCFITQHIYFSKPYMLKLMKCYLTSASLVAILGIIEFLAPDFMSFIFGFEEQTNYITLDIYFKRLGFLFWGSPLAANLIPPVFPILLMLKAENDSIIKNNYFLTIIIIFNLVAIYLSGNRISWLVLTILLIITIFKYRSFLLPYMKSYSIILTVGFVAYIYSQPVEGRYVSTFKALAGKIDTRYDSSGGERLARMNIALNSIIKTPLGTGWGSQGWIHSDILQISSSIGVIPGIIMLVGLLSLLIRLYRSYLKAISNEKTIYFGLSGLLIYVILSLIFNGNVIKVQCGVPLFTLWAISDAYLRGTFNIKVN